MRGGFPDDGSTLAALQHLWLAKVNGIALLESWLEDSRDSAMRSRLEMELEDERRHARLLDEQLRRLGGQAPRHLRGRVTLRPFREAQVQKSDLNRLVAFHRAVKTFLVNRCDVLMASADPLLHDVLERIAREDERHVRWADAQIERLLTFGAMRECNLLMHRVRAMIEDVWARPYRQLVIGL
jgi:bacterioferritin (cytochrome b1)